MSLADAFKRELSTRIVGKTITSCSRWAQKRRVMGHPFPGPYKFNVTPWTKELHDSKASWNCTLKSAQGGFTELGINLALYTVDVLKKNVLYVLPTLTDASDFSRTRFNPALSFSPYLKTVFTDSNNVGLKQAGNISLYIRGSRGDSGLKSIPVSVLILDELDEMDQSQVELAFQRLRGQPQKTAWMISTPTVPNHGVHKEYVKSTMEEFTFKCPGCNKMDIFRWPDSMHICGDDFNDPDIHKSRIKCTMCGHIYKQWQDDTGFVRQEEKMMTQLDSGVWVPSAEDCDPDRRGFAINQLYSSTVNPGEIVGDFFKGEQNEFAKQEFHKSVLGQPYVGESSQVTDKNMDTCVADYSMKQLMPTVGDNRLITMGIDQGKWNYAVILDWEFTELSTDVNTMAKPRVLDIVRFYEDEWEIVPDRLMHEYQVRAAMVDADPNVLTARSFARRFPGYVWLNRYRAGKVGKEMSITDDGSYAPIAVVDRTNWLDVTLGRFYSGRIQIPKDTPRAFREHVKNLVRVYDVDQLGNPVASYKNFGHDHFAHALNYAEMALPCAAAIATNKNIKAFL